MAPFLRQQRMTRLAHGLFCGLWFAVISLLSGCQTPRTAGVPKCSCLAENPAAAQRPVQPVSAQIPAGSPDLAGPHSVEEYVALALAQNPQIQAKAMLVQAAAQRVPQAASWEQPTVNVMGYPFFPNVPQSASGRMTVEATASQQLPWPAKLRAKADAASAEVAMAQAELAAAEREVVEQVKRAYYQLYFVQKSIDITQQSRKLAEQFTGVAEEKYKADPAARLQDLRRAQLEVANVEAELVRLRQERRSAQAQLARWLAVPPSTPLGTVGDLPQESPPLDLERLYEQAVAARPELQAQLAAIDRDRLAGDLARLNYRPEVSLGFTWREMTTDKALAPTADGLDDLGVGVMASIPIYRKRLNAAVREAEAKTAASALQYEALRNQTLAEVTDLFAQATSQQELLRLFRDDIVPKADQARGAALKAYASLGNVDFLQVIDNAQQFLRYRLAQERVASQFRQTLASLQRVVGDLEVR